MLVFLLLFEVAIVFIIVLSHNMIEKKYKEIEKSTCLYTNRRAYRTERSIAFIDGIIKKYQQFLERGEQPPDLDSMIKSSLLREYIGQFTFIGVNNVAHKSKYIMWGVIILEMAIGWINRITTSLEGVVVIISSILLAIGVEIFIIIKALEEKKEATIVLIEDYILNTYPLQSDNECKKNKDKQEEVRREGQAKELIILTEQKRQIGSCKAKDDERKIIKNQEGGKNKSNRKAELTEKDIATFISNLHNY